MSETESLSKHVTVSNNDLNISHVAISGAQCGYFGLVGGHFGLWQFWM